MTPKVKENGGTRERLLEAASRVFAKKGYRDATIAEISRRARANIAAVNYHFGGKRKLYVAVWHHLFGESIKVHPPDGGIPESASPEERLHGRIGALIRRVISPDNEFAIMEQEFGDPTGLLESSLRQAIGPLREKMIALVRELLGSKASRRQTEACVFSIMSQCMAVRRHMRLRTSVHRRSWSTPAGIDRLADHITQFSLGGIDRVRREIESAGRD